MMKELEIKAIPENFDAVLNFIAALLEETGCPPKTQMQIAVAAEEIFVNIAHYAYSPAIGNALVRVLVNGDIVIEFLDSGKPYNPLEKEDPDIAKDAETREIGGLGIYMVKNMMDTVEYRREDGYNILRIKKALS